MDDELPEWVREMQSRPTVSRSMAEKQAADVWPEGPRITVLSSRRTAVSMNDLLPSQPRKSGCRTFRSRFVETRVVVSWTGVMN